MHDLAIGFDKLELAPYRNEICFRGPDGSLFDGVRHRTAVHIGFDSGDAAFGSLRPYFEERVQPAFRALLKSALAAGEVRPDVEPDDLLLAVASLCMSTHGDGPGHAERMVALLIDGLRYGAKTTRKKRS